MAAAFSGEKDGRGQVGLRSSIRPITVPRSKSAGGSVLYQPFWPP